MCSVYILLKPKIIAVAVLSVLVIFGAESGYPQSVYVVSGNEKAQGVLLRFEGMCYMLTVSHALENDEAQIKIVTNFGQFSDAMVANQNKTLDLALLKIPNPKQRIRSLCGLRNSLATIRSLYHPLQRPVDVGQFAWLDQIASTGGGLVREMLTVSDPDVRAPRVRPVDEDFTFSRGDSGSIVYLGKYRRMGGNNLGFYESILFNEIGEPIDRPPSRSLFYGILAQVEGGEGVLINRDIIRYFLEDSLNPIDWPSIEFDFNKANILKMSRLSLLEVEINLAYPERRMITGIEYDYAPEMTDREQQRTQHTSPLVLALNPLDSSYRCTSNNTQQLQSLSTLFLCKFATPLHSSTITLRLQGGNLRALKRIRFLFDVSVY